MKHTAKVLVLTALIGSASAHAADSVSGVPEHRYRAMMTFSVSLDRGHEIRLNGIPIRSQGVERFNVSGDGESGTALKRPLWKRPAFWIVTGTVATVAITAALVAGAEGVAAGKILDSEGHAH